MQADRLPVRRHAQISDSGPGGDRTHSPLFKRQVLRRLSYKAVAQCVGQELNLHSDCGWVTATWARRCPADTSSGMGDEGWVSNCLLPFFIPHPSSLILCFSGRRGSRTLKAHRSSGFGPGAVANRLALPSVSLDGWIRTSVVRLPRPADDARLSYIQIRRPPRPTKKARGRVTPGLQGLYPKGSVSLAQRVHGPRRARAIGLGRRRRLLTTEVRITACHHALYFARRVPRFLLGVSVADIL